MYYHYCTVTYETFVLVVFHVNFFFEFFCFVVFLHLFMCFIYLDWSEKS